jgi:hypothetical protein
MGNEAKECLYTIEHPSWCHSYDGDYLVAMAIIDVVHLISYFSPPSMKAFFRPSPNKMRSLVIPNGKHFAAN